MSSMFDSGNAGSDPVDQIVDAPHMAIAINRRFQTKSIPAQIKEFETLIARAKRSRNSVAVSRIPEYRAEIERLRNAAQTIEQKVSTGHGGSFSGPKTGHFNPAYRDRKER